MTFTSIASRPTQTVATDLTAIATSKLFKISIATSIAAGIGATFLPLLWMSASYPAEIPHPHAQVAPVAGSTIAR
jgi:hypothetical protein